MTYAAPRPAAATSHRISPDLLDALDAMVDPIALVDDDGVLVEVNGAACALAGATRDALVGQPAWTIFVEPSRAEWRALLAAGGARRGVLRRGAASTTAVELVVGGRRLAGAHVVRARELRDDDAAERLALLERRFAALVEAGDETILFVAPDGTVRYVGPTARTVLGYARDELEGSDAFAPVHPDDRARVARALDDVTARPRGSASFEVRARHKDGSWRVIDATLTSRLDDDAIAAVVVNVRDVTARRTHEQELARFFELSPTLMAITSLSDGAFRRVNPAWEHALGWTDEDLRGRSWHHLVHPDDLARTRSVVTASPRVKGLENRYRAKDGSWRVLRWSGFADASLGVAYAVARDITDERRAGEELRASEERYRGVFESSPMPMWMFDADTLCMRDVNAAALAAYGYTRDEFLALHASDLRPEDEQGRIDQTLAELRRERPTVFGGNHRRKDGAVFPVEGVAQPWSLGGRRAFLCIVQDVSERNRLQAQLLQSQKMEAVGRLAGGIAHDFNNLLAVILAETEIAAGDPAASGDVAEGLRAILDAAERARALTQQLLTFSRHDRPNPNVLSIDRVVHDVCGLLARVLGEDIALDVGLGADGACIEADPSHVEQVLMNLAVNARDAMPHGGTLRIATHRATVLDDPSLLPGEYVVLSMRDDGVGMDAATAARIFEPFFTTKEFGKGTGLGLSTVFGIVERARGAIRVDTAPGRGAAFDVYWPTVRGRESSGRMRVSAAPLGSGETILLVEDDPRLRDVLARALRTSGYAVLEARDPADALARAEERAIDLLLTDVVMPGGDGVALAEAVRARSATARVVFMSGYAEHPSVHVAPLPADACFLQKPFPLDQARRVVRDALDGRRRRGETRR